MNTVLFKNEFAVFSYNSRKRGEYFMKRNLGKIIGVIFFVNMFWDAVSMSNSSNKLGFYIFSTIPGIIIGIAVGAIFDRMFRPTKVEVVVSEDKAARYNKNEGIVNELERLNKLKQDAAITEEEYQEMKEKLIKKY